MKRSTCKVLLGIGIGWIIFVFLISPAYAPFQSLIFFGFPGWILIIIAGAKWRSEEEHRDVKQAQLQALRRGKVSVQMKGRMRKLR